ncbi:MAG TPA: helix-hairpin-helix domain-containing protein [Candidatus Acidoferrum sp.]|nr:helix-hairpin-helix domain-containing protein [Candidatus Acidoferrum sp.]
MNAASLNDQVAERLRQAADLLAEQQANPFRVRAYRRAADTIAELPEELAEFVGKHGIEGLEGLPGIGPSLAAAIAEMVRTGRWGQLERLRGAAEPEKLFCSIAGIGPKLARRIHDALHVDTLEALEAAAHDGRLESVPGVGRRRASILRTALGSKLARVRPAVRHAGREPDVATLLDVDREYRTKAAEDSLPKIAPKRFNPEGKAWLPILHAERNHWQFTALFSNTARAHELGRINDWVVIYFHTDTEPEGQRTVVTEKQGELTGRRVVRGRESECLVFYAALHQPAA